MLTKKMSKKSLFDFNFGGDLLRDIEKDISHQEKDMERESKSLGAEERKLIGNIPEVGDKFGDYQEVIEHVLDVSPSWKFVNITKMGNRVTKFYFVSKHGDLIFWVKPCGDDEGLVVVKENLRQFDNKMMKSMEYFE